MSKEITTTGVHLDIQSTQQPFHNESFHFESICDSEFLPKLLGFGFNRNAVSACLLNNSFAKLTEIVVEFAETCQLSTCARYVTTSTSSVPNSS